LGVWVGAIYHIVALTTVGGGEGNCSGGRNVREGICHRGECPALESSLPAEWCGFCQTPSFILRFYFLLTCIAFGVKGVPAFN